MKILKKITSLLLLSIVLSFSVGSVYLSSYNVSASSTLNDISDKLTYFILDTTGAISRSPVGGISPISTSIRNSILNEIEGQISNNGIYEDNDGNIVFTSTAMNNIYSLLNGGNNPNFRCVNNYSNFESFFPSSVVPYINSTVVQNVEAVVNYAKNTGSPYILVAYGTKYDYRPYSSISVNVRYQFSAIILNDNLAFIDTTNQNYTYNCFRNSDNTNIYCTLYTTNFTFNGSTYTYKNPTSTTRGDLFISDWGGGSNFYNLIKSSFPTTLNYENFAPGNTYYPNGMYESVNYYCTNSLLFCNGITSYNTQNNQTSGVIYFDNSNTITINKNVLIDNNWTSIYNSYVTNVSNTYNETVNNNNGSSITIKDIRNIMNTYLQPLYNAVDEGLTDIADKLNYINEWLSKIYSNGSLIITRLDSIIQIITNNMGSGNGTTGTACAWSDQEVDIVLDKLSRIYTEQVDNDRDVISALNYIKTKISNLDTTLSTASSNIGTITSNTSSIVTSLDTELSRLATVLNKLDTIISKMGQNRITQPTIDPDIIDDLTDLLPQSILDDIFSPWTAIGSIIESVVPFCYIGVAVAIMSNLSAEAEAPYFEIPITYDNNTWGIHIDEKFVIDLEPYEDLSTIIRLFFILAFTVSLMFFSLPLVNHMTGIFDGR